AWHTLTFTSPDFGGFASNMALVVELEEKAPISEITISQNQGSGGAFTVAVSNEPDPDNAVMITDGSFTGPDYTADAVNEDGDPIEARYVIINFTELPTLLNTSASDRRYGLRISEIDVNYSVRRRHHKNGIFVMVRSLSRNEPQTSGHAMCAHSPQQSKGTYSWQRTSPPTCTTLSSSDLGQLVIPRQSMPLVPI